MGNVSYDSNHTCCYEFLNNVYKNYTPYKIAAIALYYIMSCQATQHYKVYLNSEYLLLYKLFKKCNLNLKHDFLILMFIHLEQATSKKHS